MRPTISRQFLSGVREWATLLDVEDQNGKSAHGFTVNGGCEA
jgi:hypothetical protein